MTESLDPPVPPARAARRPFLVVLPVALVLLLVAREAGLLGLSLSAKTFRSRFEARAARTTNAVTEKRPRPDATPLVERGGLAIFGPRGPSTDVVLSMLPHHPGVTGFVELVYEPPSSYVPLWKTADVVFDVHAELDLARDDEPSVHSQYHFHLEGKWQAIGPLSGREFAWAIASAVGQDLAKSFGEEIEQMRKQ